MVSAPFLMRHDFSDMWLPLERLRALSITPNQGCRHDLAILMSKALSLATKTSCKHLVVHNYVWWAPRTLLCHDLPGLWPPLERLSAFPITLKSGEPPRSCRFAEHSSFSGHEPRLQALTSPQRPMVSLARTVAARSRWPLVVVRES